MSCAPSILPDPFRLHLLHLSTEATSIIATVRTTAASADCPLCGHPSAHVHSRYTRRLADLPWHGVAMKLVLSARKFFCDTPDCARQIFTERLPEVVAPYARRTRRLDQWFTAVGFAAGGAAGARLLQARGLSTTPAIPLARIPVSATIGRTTWQASLLPWADGSAQITIKKTVRDKEALALGQELQVLIVPRT